MAAQPVVLCGTLHDASGEPLAHRTIQLVDNSGAGPRTVEDSTLTDEGGHFEFEIERAGRLVLRVAVEDAFSEETAVFTDEAGRIGVDVMLNEAEGTGADRAPVSLRFHDADSRAAHFARLLDLSGGDGTTVPPEPDLAFEHARMLRDVASLDADSAAAVLALVPASSPLWTAGGDNYLVLRAVDQTGSRESYADYLERYVMTQADTATLHGVLFEVLKRARRRGDEERVARYLDRVGDGLADTFWGSRALAEFGPTRRVRPGEPVPPFSIPLLPLGTATVTPGDLKGKVYLLDFWATWCVPCMAERDALEEVYAAYSEREFEIVSVSLDFDPNDVAGARERWPMPWIHAYLSREEESTARVMESFELGALPKLLLVDADGVIVAGGAGFKPEDARGVLDTLLD